MSRTPGLDEVISLAMDRRLEEVYTAIPARVTAYDPVTQQCHAQPSIKLAYENEEGTRTVEDPPVVTNVPVMWPRGGGFRLTFPLAAGDDVLLVFSMRSIDLWQERGGCLDPQDDRRFHISDAIAVPGMGFKRSLQPTPDDHATIGYDTGDQIHMYQEGISIAAEWGDAVALAKAAQVEARLTALETAHYHIAPSSGGATSGPTVADPAYLADFPPESGLILNPAHGSPGHVHGSPEPLYASSPGTAGSAVATTKVRGI